MKNKIFNILGLMSGTSMDGIDISLVKTNGNELYRNGKNYFYKYKSRKKNFLLNLDKSSLGIILKKKNLIDKIITLEHYNAVKESSFLNETDYISFHGQTIYHSPEEKKTLQLGDPQLLANLTKKKVFFNFRKNDINNNGQGAPIAPVYHKYLIKSFKLDLPACVINIGGISNIAYWDGVNLVGFDVGPGNALMDKFVRLKTGNFYDNSGHLASKGRIILKSLNQFLKDPFFKKQYPKSLDKNYFNKYLNDLILNNFCTEDIMTTLSNFTSKAILNSFKLLPKKPRTFILMGGGYKNKFLKSNLEKAIGKKFLNEQDLKLSFDFVESELMAFLAGRKLYDLPITFPSTTGVNKPSTGGDLYFPNLNSNSL